MTAGNGKPMVDAQLNLTLTPLHPKCYLSTSHALSIILNYIVSLKDSDIFIIATQLCLTLCDHLD